MNFDDIKDAWNNNQDNDKIIIPSSVDQLKTAQLPVERLKKTMKSEFIIQFISLIFIGFAPRILYLLPVLTVPFYALYIISLAVSAYYFFRLYVFYKTINTVSLTSKDSLYELYYEAKLSIEVYKSFTYMLFPFMLMMCLFFLMSWKGEVLSQIYTAIINNEHLAIWLALTFATGIVLVMLMTELWARSSYGKYLKQIKVVLDEFKE